MPNPERLPEADPTNKTIRQSPDELNSLIKIQENLLDGEPEYLAYQLALKGLHLRREKLFGTKPIESVVPPEPNFGTILRNLDNTDQE